jgi:DNA replication and repair protein RecF
VLRTVLFAPEDLALVKGEPDGRRRFMDQLLVLMMPRVSAVLSDYERVLRQRSALLKSARSSRRSGGSSRAESAAAELATLDVWDARLAELGAEILSLRIQLVEVLRPAVAAAYEQVSDADGDAEIAYRSSLPALSTGNPPELSTGPGDNFADVGRLRDLLLEALVTARPQELERGVSLVGPHRDDLVLTLGGLPAKGYASHGESWSFALALRLASFRLLGGDPQNSADSPAFWDPELGTDADPVLILDDVFAELDVRRRQRLADLVLPARQVLVTAAVAEDIPAALDGVRFHVEPGTVTRD